MSKKFLTLSLFAFAMVFVSGTAKAQLTLYNGSNCAITAKVAAYYGSPPCDSTPCYSDLLNIPSTSNGFFNVPPCGGATTPGPNYVAVKFSTFPGISGYVDDCFGPATFSFIDCLGTPRTLTIVSSTFAAIQ